MNVSTRELLRNRKQIHDNIALALEELSGDQPGEKELFAARMLLQWALKATAEGGAA